MLLLKKIKISTTLDPPQIVDEEPFSTGELSKTYFFSVSSYCGAMRGPPATPLKGHGYTLSSKK